MRPLLITAAVLAIAATSAAAAGLPLNTGTPGLSNTASGSVDVADCSEGIDVDLVPDTAFDQTLGDFTIASVTLTSLTPGLAERCAGSDVRVVLQTATGEYVELGPVRVEAGQPDTITLPVPRSVVHGTTTAHVLFDRSRGTGGTATVLAQLTVHGQAVLSLIDENRDLVASTGDRLVVDGIPTDPTGTTRTMLDAGSYEVTDVDINQYFLAVNLEGRRYAKFWRVDPIASAVFGAYYDGECTLELVQYGTPGNPTRHSMFVGDDRTMSSPSSPCGSFDDAQLPATPFFEVTTYLD